MEKGKGVAESQSSAKRHHTNPRPRGRPLKEQGQGDAAADLQRVRVRRAQKAFRIRKEQHVNALEEKCRRLESVIEEMSNTFMGFSDDLLNSGNVQPEITGVLKATMERFLVLSEQVQDQEGEALGNTEDLTNMSSLKAPSDVSSSSKILSGVPSDPSPGSSAAADTPRLSPSQIGPSASEAPPLSLARTHESSAALRRLNATNFGGSADPYLNYGLWGNPLQPSPNDGTSAIPYILAGRDSFASRLYFESIVLAVRTLRGEAPREFANSMFRYKFRYTTPGRILGVVSGVLDMLLRGTSQVPTPANLIDSGELDEDTVKAAIVGEVVLQGGSVSEYLATWDVERYLRDKWALAIDSNAVRIRRPLLETPEEIASSPFRIEPRSESSSSSQTNTMPFAPTMIPGFSHSEQVVLDAQPLLQKLTAAMVSIGEGPRWHLSSIDAAVQTFFRENSVSKRFSEPIET